MRIRAESISAIVASFLCINFLIFARPAAQTRTLLITGHDREIPLVEMNRRLYVEIGALARLTNASLSYRGHQVVLTLPLLGTESTVATLGANQSEFSKEFLHAGIEQVAVIREWRSTLATAVNRGYPITEDWMNTFNDRARKNLAFVSVAISTESDRSAYELLANEYQYMKTLNDQFLDASRSRTYIPTDSLDNNPLDRKILACGLSLEAMAANGRFADDGSCH